MLLFIPYKQQLAICNYSKELYMYISLFTSSVLTCAKGATCSPTHLIIRALPSRYLLYHIQRNKNVNYYVMLSDHLKSRHKNFMFYNL